MAPLVRTGGSRHTGLAALPHRNIQQVIENTILQMGNLNENSLKEIITDIKSNYVLNTVFTEGFTPFIKLLEDNKIDYPHKLASPCEFCEFLFKDDWFLQLLASVNYYENIRK